MMIYYKLLKRVNVTNITVYYLVTKDFKYKKPIRVFDPVDLNMYVYKDFDSLFPISKLNRLNEDLFDILTYKEVEEFFSYIQDYAANNNPRIPEILIDLERVLLYWDDYN